MLVLNKQLFLRMLVENQNSMDRERKGITILDNKHVYGGVQTRYELC